MVADRFHDKNRVNGLTELMMTGNYELSDCLSFTQQKQPTTEPPYPVQDMVYLKQGETLDVHLQNRGIPAQEIPLHMYAYEKIGINPKKLRPFDPVPIFDTKDIQNEVNRAGGLDKALAETRTARAKRYMKTHPGEYLFTIRPDQSPQQLAGTLLQLPPLVRLEERLKAAGFGTLTPKDHRFILTMISSVNSGNFLVEVNRRGDVVSAPRYIAGTDVYVNDAFLDKVATYIEKTYIQSAVYIPQKLPGGAGFRQVEFSDAEQKIIEGASGHPNTRKYLALVLGMEQKQEEGFVSRGTVKKAAEALSFVSPRIRPRSLGLFQIRPQGRADLEFIASLAGIRTAGKSDEALFEECREILIDNPEINARLAAHRVEQITTRMEEIYIFHNERFNGTQTECAANALNAYHSSEVRVLTNIFSVWAAFLEEQFHIPLGDATEATPSTRNIMTRFARIAHILKTHGAITIDENTIASGVQLLEGNKTAFLQSPLLSSLETAYQQKTASRLSLNIPPAVIDNPHIVTKYLNYGIRATRYGTLEAIENHSLAMRKSKESTEVMLAQR